MIDIQERGARGSERSAAERQRGCGAPEAGGGLRFRRSRASRRRGGRSEAEPLGSAAFSAKRERGSALSPWSEAERGREGGSSRRYLANSRRPQSGVRRVPATEL